MLQKKSLQNQQEVCSSFKNRITVKVLVGATPGGLVTFGSPANEGATSVRQIVERGSRSENVVVMTIIAGQRTGLMATIKHCCQIEFSRILINCVYVW